jgi:hypothetical protein
MSLHNLLLRSEFYLSKNSILLSLQLADLFIHLFNIPQIQVQDTEYVIP